MLDNSHGFGIFFSKGSLILKVLLRFLVFVKYHGEFTLGFLSVHQAIKNISAKTSK